MIFLKKYRKLFTTFTILCLILSEINSFVSIRHQRWQQQDRKLSQITDVLWNYCDVKCTYLQVLYPEHDFVVLYFEGIKSGQKFGVCYVKQQEKYMMWNNVVKNQFYQKNCGQDDDKDYMKLNTQYKLKSILAIGKGNQLPNKYSPFEASHQ